MKIWNITVVKRIYRKQWCAILSVFLQKLIQFSQFRIRTFPRNEVSRKRIHLSSDTIRDITFSAKKSTFSTIPYEMTYAIIYFPRELIYTMMKGDISLTLDKNTFCRSKNILAICFYVHGRLFVRIYPFHFV